MGQPVKVSLQILYGSEEYISDYMLPNWVNFEVSSSRSWLVNLKYLEELVS